MPTPSSTPPKPSPAQQLAEDISRLQSDLNSVQGDVRLSSLRDEIEDIETNTNGLEQRIRDLRAREYVFEKELEAKATDMRRRWNAVRLQALSQTTNQANKLDLEMRSVEALMMQVTSRAGNIPVARPLVSQTQSALSSLRSSISGAENSVRGMYDAYKDELTKYTEHLKEVEWTMTQVAEASFRLLPSECAVKAVEAVWVKDGKEDKGDPKGVLFLTDQRLLFEQKQEIATKKILFITTEKQKVQQLMLEAPIALLQTVVGTKQGIFNNEDHLELTFASGAPVYQAHFHLDGQDCNAWQGLLGQAKSKAFDKDRVAPVDQAAVDKVKAVPALCPSCGGGINQVILRGVDTVTCEYCGFVIRL